MGRTLFSKVKAVHSISAFLLVILVNIQSYSQSTQTLKVTYSCSSVRLEKVIEHISRATGLYFVYSSDKIPLNTQVTLSVKDKPVDQVLAQLGKQLNLSFKMHERHVTVKMNDVPFVVLAAVSNPVVHENVTKNNDRESNQETVDLFANKNPEFFSLHSDHEKYLVPLQRDLKTGVLHPISAKYLASPAKYLKTNWFMSVSSVINDYSMGFELQAGLRNFYAVYSPTWLRGDQFHGAFGVGSSFRLSDNFSLNPVYTFASVRQSQTTINRFGSGPSYRTISDIQHHQFKLMLQYSLSRKVNFRAGATFNQLIAENHNKGIWTSESHSMMYRHNPDYGKQIESGELTSGNFRIPAETTVYSFWVGWEASISYKINFLRKP